ncbi:uncharacterized protein [Primulina eburnea]|uniref:uncharacterized protein n=1 Tax=Primulina eburnea TaxID=1245227 RepID=UPI003C6C4C58
MSFITWNARGLGNQRAFRELKRLVAEKRPSILFICETKMRDFQCSWWKHVLGFSGMFVVNCDGRRGGLMLFWKEPLCVTIHSYTSGHIDSIIHHGNKKWRFNGFYGNPETQNRHLSWALLRRLSCMPEFKEYPWLVGGDFNKICFDREKLGGNPRPLSYTRAFREVLNACSLPDLHGTGEYFTWVNRRSSDDIIFERLDRLVATLGWRLLYPADRVCSLEFYHSDHRPLLLDLRGQLQSAPQPNHLVRFEQHWVTETDFKDVVRMGWNKSDQAVTFPDRIKGCKENLRKWVGNRFGKLPKQIQGKRKNLNYLRTHDRWHTSVARISELER